MPEAAHSMNTKKTFLFRQALLLLAACVVMFSYFSVSINNRLYNNKLRYFGRTVAMQWPHMSLQDRYRARFGDDAYLFTQYIKFYVDSPKVNNPLILLPPPEYLKMYNFTAMVVPEPIVYYYFTGHQCVTTQSQNVYDANYAVYLNKGHLAIGRVKNKQEVAEVLELYKTRQ